MVRANPLPAHRERTPLKSWYEVVVSILILAGFMQAPDEDGPAQLTAGQKLLRAVRLSCRDDYVSVPRPAPPVMSN